MGNIYSMYFSATGNTRKMTDLVAKKLASDFGYDSPKTRNFTLPGSREHDVRLGPDDLLVIGFPTYAGKLPNKIMPDLKRRLSGEGTLCAAIVTYGNRGYDNSLAELVNILTDNGFRVIAGAAFSCRHAFTDKVGAGRPDAEDERTANEFADHIHDKIEAGKITAPDIPGDPEAPYYTPRREDGEPAKFLKAAPKVDMDLCIYCGTCAERCPMGSISHSDITVMTGICIKCQACVRYCPTGARYFDDPDFLSHVRMLEENFTENKKDEVFI
ncbi:MAG: EFR1 family ferrodoxin [Eubacteriales bacterium]|nr:EFR1 family ferrodoxin [Eubacteriales bacterium]